MKIKDVLLQVKRKKSTIQCFESKSHYFGKVNQDIITPLSFPRILGKLSLHNIIITNTA